MLQYTCVRKISDFSASITFLRFSPTGDYLAVGDDEGVVTILDISGRAVWRLVNATRAPVTAILWHPSSSPKTCIVGHAHGGILIYRFLPAKTEGRVVDNVETVVLPQHSQGAIRSLVYDSHTSRLAAIQGQEIILMSLDLEQAQVELSTVNPSPNSLCREVASPLAPRCLHFLNGGKSILILYLDHGALCWNIAAEEVEWTLETRTRIASSALSQTRNALAVCNLWSGFDQYDLESRKLVRSYEVPMVDNVELPAKFIRRGEELLLGSSCGNVQIFSTVSLDMHQLLPHSSADVIQAIDHCHYGSEEFIATAPDSSHHASPGPHCVCIWTTLGTSDAGHHISSAGGRQTPPISSNAPPEVGPSILRSYKLFLGCGALALITLWSLVLPPVFLAVYDIVRSDSRVFHFKASTAEVAISLAAACGAFFRNLSGSMCEYGARVMADRDLLRSSGRKIAVAAIRRGLAMLPGGLEFLREVIL